jgi:antitoxin (DNA-binding transcriptional repressor) of toxin-antitoxin stability system
MQINMLEAKSQLSRLVQAALDGEEVILARNGEPVARITRYVPVEGKRNPGAFKDAIRMAGDWDRPATNRRLDAAMAAGVVFPPEPDAPSAREPRRSYRVAKRARARAR